MEGTDLGGRLQDLAKYHPATNHTAPNQESQSPTQGIGNASFWNDKGKPGPRKRSYSQACPDQMQAIDEFKQELEDLKKDLKQDKSNKEIKEQILRIKKKISARERRLRDLYRNQMV